MWFSGWMVSVRTSIQASRTTPVTHATPVTQTQTRRSQPYATTLPRPCYAMADHMRTSLIVDALNMAARKITIRAGITIFHSDRGCQYTSQEFADITDELGIRRSLGRTGTCYDNALAESFNGPHPEERAGEPDRVSHPGTRPN